MPWQVERDASALSIDISAPMEGEWEALMEAVDAQLEPTPLAVHLPSRLEGGTKMDADVLKLLWHGLASLGIPLLPPK
jgi:hypothetical protein